jgi:uncharacterized protein YdeI (YjbR/CyaY-like superfamily)
MYKGILCGMGAFKEHCIFGFWKGSLIFGDNGGKTQEAAGHFGRITKVGDLPSKKVLSGYIKEAMKLNENGVKPSTTRRKAPGAPVVPEDLAGALQKNGKARATFEGFSPSNKREYIEWITGAKTEATRARRLETAVEWMAEGKPRNWKYMNC